MKILKYVVLGLVMLNIPSAILDITQNGLISNIMSTLTFVLLILYFILIPKTSTNKWMILIGFTFFIFASLSSQEYFPSENREFFVYVIKYFLFIICGYELVKRTTNIELFILLFIGAISILLQILFFNNPLEDTGRYSGFFLNPNKAGFICASAYALTFGLKKKKMRRIGQISITLLGLLTFSRTFIAIWLILNLFSIKINPKNIKVFIYGLVVLIGLVFTSEFLPVKTNRLNEINAVLTGENASTNDLSSDSRTDTWALYYDALMEHPFFGNGFNAFSGNSIVPNVGVHNSYLRVWGEAGVFVFLIFISMFIVMLKDAFVLFSIAPHIFLICICLVLYLATTHNYFDYLYMLFISMWIQSQIKQLKIEIENKNQREIAFLA